MLQNTKESVWLENFGNIELVLKAPDNTIEAMKILDLGEAEKSRMKSLSIFSSSRVPKHLKLFSYVTDALRLHVNCTLNNNYNITIRMGQFLKMCEVLEEYGSAIRLVTILETMLNGLIDSDVDYRSRHYLLGTISRLNFYLESLKELQDQD